MPWIRVVSGVVAIAFALTIITLGGWYFTLGVGIVVCLSQLEYFQMMEKKGLNPAGKLTLICSELLLITATLKPTWVSFIFALTGTLICFYLLFQPKIATIGDIATSILGLFYGGYLPSYWIRLREGFSEGFINLPFMGYWFPEHLEIAKLPFGLTLTLLVMACIWASDIGAYIMGKWLGKTRLCDISPKKTVEGAIFGFLGSISVATWGAWYFHWHSWQTSGILVGLLIGLTSLLGDLLESVFKRDAGVKDSGQFIPGHGGVMDRTDSYVFTAPVIYYFVKLLMPLLP